MVEFKEFLARYHFLILLASGRDLLDRCPVSDHVYVTTLLVLPGYFWVGTSVGIIMVYRIPLIEGVPLITAKPYLAMDGHKGQVQYDSSVLVVIQ